MIRTTPTAALTPRISLPRYGQFANGLRVAAACAVSFSTLLISAAAAAEEPPTFSWARQIGSPQREVVYELAVDGGGNVLIAGSTSGPLSGKASGGSDAFLMKFNPQGQTLWSKQIGSQHGDYGRGLATDADGNVYFVIDTFDHDFGGGKLRGGFGYLFKFDVDGNQIWAKPIGARGNDSVGGICLDARGNIYIAGFTDGQVAGENQGADDIFLIKFDAEGQQIWSMQFGSEGTDRPNSVAVDHEGNTYLTGWTSGRIGAESFGRHDGFLVKVGPDGKKLWANQIGTNRDEDGNRVAVDDQGVIYVAGQTNGQIGQELFGIADAFLIKYRADGQVVWSTQFGSKNIDDCHALAIRADGSVMIAGTTRDVLGQKSWGRGDMFIACFDQAGNKQWAEQYGTDADDSCFAMAIGPDGALFLGGGTSGSLDQPNKGITDACILKLQSP